MKLIELTTDDKATYKKFFIHGLQHHDDCFRTSPLDEEVAPFPTLNTTESFTLGAVNEENILMGVVSFERESKVKFQHKGLLFRMYVDAKFAGQGIGKNLLAETIMRAKLLPGLEQINLTVIASNTKAKNLYSKFGFQSFSLEKNAVLSPRGNYYDEEQMVLFLSPNFSV